VRRSDFASGAVLPISLRWALDRLDVAAESGLESIVREIVRLLGFRVTSQVSFPLVGRVDLVVEDWVVVEADGGRFHDAEVTARDRRRDALLVSQGCSVLHFRYAQVVFDRTLVATTIISAVATHRRIRNSGSLVRRARNRAEKYGLA
jgi:very-short-patch-repair endonuclease